MRTHETNPSLIRELQTIKEELENNTSDLNGQTFLRLCNLIEQMIINNEAQHMAERYDSGQELEEDRWGNFDLDMEDVKGLILDEIGIGETFYPSDLANKHNLDLRTVMEVMSELAENGQISEKATGL